MSDTKQAHQGAVTSIGGSDLLMCVAPGGGYHPISFDNLMAAIKSGIQVGGRNLLRDTGTYRGMANAGTYKGLGVYKGGPWGHPVLYLSEPLEAGETVTLSFYCKGVAYWAPCGYMYGSDSEWTRIVKTITPNDSYSSIQLVRPSTTNNDALSYFCGVKLERGNVATDWTPAPKDIASS